FPSEEAFARLLSRLGIGPDTQVVVYDQRDGSVAARLWFMLRAHGHERASLLDGGLDAWVAAGLPLTRDEPEIEPAPLRKLTLDRSRIADAEEVVRRGKAVVLDARAPERYRGETEPIDKKAGHIPGAANHFFGWNLDEAGTFRTPEELRAKLGETIGAQVAADHVVCYCGSGVTACHNLLALE